MGKHLRMLLLALLLAACASNPAAEKNAAEKDYELAKHMLEKGEYGKAAEFLEHFGADHPYSSYTIQAELLRIFAAYKDKEYILSETLSEEFIRRHPRHPNVDYAKYMLAMSHYREAPPAEKDPSQTLAAIKSFKRLLREHPGSPYAKDGKRRLQKLYNTLARHELNVGKFYFDHDRYVAAANRFQVVLEKYQTTPAIEEALFYLAASFDRLGIRDEARNAALLLRHNFPKSRWSHKAARFLRR